MAYRSVFLAVLLGTAMIVAALLINRARPSFEVNQPTISLVRASGKCAECHRRETAAVVHEFELSRHALKGVTCLDCHQTAGGQEELDHRGFKISKQLTGANCKQCHPHEYEQFLRSRHAAPAWAAVRGPEDFSAEQIQFSEQFHPGAVNRKANMLAICEGAGAISRGCTACHDVGKPNQDGSIGSCTKCHARHVASVELARLPETCGQCHLGPDHSQIEIYHESKHGVLFNAQRKIMNLEARPKELKVTDMPVPTCATCHMSGIEGLKVTHDTTERLSYFLFAEHTELRPTGQQGQLAMKETCAKCHTTPTIERFYTEAITVLNETNDHIKEASTIVEKLRVDKLLTPVPFDEPIEFLYYDLWHYGGRTAKHGAFMGGADFVQWHGYYEVVSKLVELKRMAEELRSAHQTPRQDRPADDKPETSAVTQPNSFTGN